VSYICGLNVTRAGRDSDPGRLASFAKSLQFFAAAALAGLLIIGLAPHFFPQPAAFAKFAEASDRFLNRLAGSNP
jgi:hypothetical protein